MSHRESLYVNWWFSVSGVISNTIQTTNCRFRYYSLSISMHVIQSALHVVQVGYGYLLMLVVMTFNGWLFLSICFGAGVGYLLFAKSRHLMGNFREQNEHCHWNLSITFIRVGFVCFSNCNHDHTVMYLQCIYSLILSHSFYNFFRLELMLVFLVLERCVCVCDCVWFYYCIIRIQ